MLDLQEIRKSYGTKTVLHDVSFPVARSRMTGFVGGNGAGKTTTMRILLGVLAADDGRVLLDGRPVTADDRRRFGYMPEERGLYPKMKVAEQLVYLARLHGIDAPGARRRTTELLDRLGLAERAGDKLESLSLGNQQRAQIAAALVHDPEVLVLDEPFSGLDPIAVDVVVGVLRERTDAGVPVLFSSHQLDIVERLCDDLVVIADGRIRVSGDTERLRREHGGGRYELLTAGDAGWVREADGVRVVAFDGGYALFEASPEAAQRILLRATETGEVVSFGPQQASLAQIFRDSVVPATPTESR